MIAEPIKIFIECLIPITVCNLRCHYCYVTQRGNNTYKKPRMEYAPRVIGEALTKKRLGGTAYISICGAGETLLTDELPEIIKNLLQNGHYINVTTNGTLTKRIEEILSVIPSEQLPHIHFSFSFHYLELIRKNMIDTFFSNIKKVKNAGCSILVQFNLCDEYEPYLDTIKKIVKENTGAFPQVAVTRSEIDLSKDIRIFTRHSMSEYNRLGRDFKSELFNFTIDNFMKKQHDYCYAGNWAYVLNLSTGAMRACYESKTFQNIFKDVKSKIELTTIGKHCPSIFCMNSSHFLSLGVIPTLQIPSYGGIRNRTFGNDSWYNKTMSNILMQKLSDTNEQYSFRQKLANEKKYYLDLVKYYRGKVKRNISISNIKNTYNKIIGCFRFEHSQLQKYERIFKESSINTDKYHCDKTDSKVVIFMVADYGNIGDVAISIAQKRILRKIYESHKIIEIPFAQSMREIKTIKSLCNKDDIITIVGGGNMGDKYYAFEEIRGNIIRQFPKNKIISFPQTIDFSNSRFGKKALKFTKKIYSQHSNLVIFAREKRSFNLMKRHFRKNKVFLAPDIVMTLPLRNFFNKRKGVIISMRNDKEKFVSDFEFDIIVNFAKENFEKFSYYDSHIGRDNINFKEGEKELDLILNEYGKSKMVLTDRLHGMIFSYITGTPAIVFPNNNKKVEECYEWIKDSNTIRFLKDINDSNLKALLTKISHSNFSIEQEKYDNKRKFFEALIIDSIDAS